LNPEEENKLIISHYRQLLRVSQWSREAGDIKIIRKAFNVAVEAHKDMRRKSGEPYILHPLAVAKIAAEEIGLGTTSIVCALLHDVVEDTDTTLDDIEKDFGPKVREIIDGLTKISDIFDHQNSPQAENFRKMILTLSKDVRVILIKLCDRLHNMRTLSAMSEKGQLKIASETTYLYAPLSHRLGLYAIKTELEDLALKYMQPEIYQQIKHKLNSTKEQRNKYIRNFIKPVKELLQEELQINFDIKGRPKSIASILNKMSKKNLAFEDVYDLFAIRIILDSDLDDEKTDCWNVYSMITDIYQPNPSRMRDWISVPKSNGYESLHATVLGPKNQWVEVQIRSRRMDEIAEKGYAAHWKYKEQTSTESNIDLWLKQIRDIIDKPEADALEILDEFKMNLYGDEVFAFTPKGELRKLPKGATVLDFAFDIHSEVGAQCLGVKVNGKLVSLNQIINNGDQIEILTSSKQKPSKDWLNFIQTSKARTRILQSLKQEKRQIAAIGKEYLERKFRTAGFPYNQTNLNKLLVHFNILDELELTYQIGREKIDRESLKLKSILGKELQKKTFENLTPIISPKKGTSSKEIILGDNTVDMPYSFATCCEPIPGDKVVGFITIGGEIKIHQTKCKNAINLMSKYGYRIISAKWVDGVTVEDLSFKTELEITGLDSMGLVAKITDVVSKELKINMLSLGFKSNQGTFTGNLVLEVNNTAELNKIINKLKEVDTFLNIKRKDLTEKEIELINGE
jgi:GTP pyrophosphokinase